MAEITEMEKVLLHENEILDNVLSEQKKLREAVQGKTWDKLMDTIAAINMLTESFEKAEAERVVLEARQTDEMKKATMPVRAEVRGKLVKSKTENKALGSYISIMREFIQGVIDEALPQSRSTVYSQNGSIVHAKPKSVVVNTLS